MKVLLCTPYNAMPNGEIGGVAIWGRHIMDAYQKEPITGLKIDLYTMDHPHKAQLCKNKLQQLYIKYRSYRSHYKAIKKKLDTTDYDVLHICTSASFGLIKDDWIIDYAHRKDVKVVLHFHYGRIPQTLQINNWESKLLKKVCMKVDMLIPIDKSSYHALVNYGFKKVYNLPNPLGYEVAKIIESYSNVNKQNREVLYVGHVIAAKGVYELIEACTKIPNIKLKIVGNISDTMRTSLMDYAKQRTGEIEWLSIVGNMTRKDCLRAMKQCSVFVLPSYTEGFPNVIIESMACGCSIVSTPVGAIPEMLEINSNKPCGIVVPKKDSTSLRDAITRLLDDSEMAETIGKEAQKKVYEKYYISSVWNQLTSIWTSVR